MTTTEINDDDMYVGPPGAPHKYRLHRAAAPAGGEGQVWEAFTDTQGVETLVAVKDLGTDDIDAQLAAATEQVQLLQAIEHPGVVRARESFAGAAPHYADNPTKEPRHAYLVMAWAAGQNLRIWALDHPVRTWSQVSQFTTEIAAALAHLHSGADTGGQPVLHRDIKPSNVMVRDSGKVQLVDFGLARGAYRSQPGGHTIGYVAPEIDPACGGTGPYSTASDLFALAGVVYFLAVGEDPPQDHSLAVIRSKLAASPVLTHQDALIEHIMSGLAPVESRPRDVKAWASGFTSVSTVLPDNTGALPVVGPFDTNDGSAITDQATWKRRKWPWLAAAALLIVALAAGLLLAGHSGNSSASGAGADSVALSATTISPTTSTSSTTTTAPTTTTTRAPTTTSTAAPPPAPALASSLTQLQPTSGTVITNRPATMDGIQYTSAVRQNRHPFNPYIAEYNLNAAYSRFSGIVGFDDTADASTLRWELRVSSIENGAERILYQTYLYNGQHTNFDVNVTGVRRFQISVRLADKEPLSAGPSTNYPTVWANSALS